MSRKSSVEDDILHLLRNKNFSEQHKVERYVKSYNVGTKMVERTDEKRVVMRGTLADTKPVSEKVKTKA